MAQALLPPQQQHEHEQPRSLTELLEQLLADVAETNTTTTTTTNSTTTNRNGEEKNDSAERDNDSVLINTVDDRQRRRLIVVESLLRKELFPLRTRIKIDDLIDEYHTNLKEDVHDMITDQRTGENYAGLDSDRDTIKEVTSILRLVPEVLQQRKTTTWVDSITVFEDDDEEDEVVREWVDNEDAPEGADEGEYPIQCLTYGRDNGGHMHFNIKAVPFIHLFAQLALEYNIFDDDQRGGLLIEDGVDDNTFTNLVVPFSNCNLSDDNHYRADEVRTNELIQLRQMNLLTVADVREFGLLSYLLSDIHFSHKSMTFLIEWSPDILLLTTGYNDTETPLHCATQHTISDFRFLFEYMIQYFPYKTGIAFLFRNGYYRYDTEERITPFGSACQNFERQNVIQVVEDVLAQYSGTTPINTVEAVVLAATDPIIHLDCLYFLIQRQPDILSSSSMSSSISSRGRRIVPSFLSGSTTNASVCDEDCDADDRGRDTNTSTDTDHADENQPATTTTTTITRKSKRKRGKDYRSNRPKRNHYCPDCFALFLGIVSHISICPFSHVYEYRIKILSKDAS